MKNFVLSLILLGFCIAGTIQAQNNPQNSKTDVEMIFDEIDHNFGTIEYKGNGTFEFVFKNTGKAPLVIQNVQTSCGCTTPSYSTEPIPPKGKGKIVVKYDTERISPFIKTIKVYSNAKNSPVELTIRGEVKQAK